MLFFVCFVNEKNVIYCEFAKRNCLKTLDRDSLLRVTSRDTGMVSVPGSRISHRAFAAQGRVV